MFHRRAAACSACALAMQSVLQTRHSRRCNRIILRIFSITEHIANRDSTALCLIWQLVCTARLRVWVISQSMIDRTDWLLLLLLLLKMYVNLYIASSTNFSETRATIEHVWKPDWNCILPISMVLRSDAGSLHTVGTGERKLRRT